MNKAEYFLITGLAVATCATALFQLVIIGVISLALFPLALVLLLIGVVHAKDPGTSAGRATVGLLLFFAGIVALGYSALHAGSMGYSTILHQTRTAVSLPSVVDWITLFMTCVISAVLLSAGLALRTHRIRARLIPWTAAFLAPPVIGLLLFFVLAQLWPITA